MTEWNQRMNHHASPIFLRKMFFVTYVGMVVLRSIVAINATQDDVRACFSNNWKTNYALRTFCFVPFEFNVRQKKEDTIECLYLPAVYGNSNTESLKWTRIYTKYRKLYF